MLKGLVLATMICCTATFWLTVLGVILGGLLGGAITMFVCVFGQLIYIIWALSLDMEKKSKKRKVKKEA